MFNKPIGTKMTIPQVNTEMRNYVNCHQLSLDGQIIIPDENIQQLLGISSNHLLTFDNIILVEQLIPTSISV